MLRSTRAIALSTLLVTFLVAATTKALGQSYNVFLISARTREVVAEGTMQISDTLSIDPLSAFTAKITDPLKRQEMQEQLLDSFKNNPMGLGRTNIDTKVPGAQTLYHAYRGLGLILTRKMNFWFTSPDLLPIDPNTGCPNYELREHIDAEIIPTRWDMKRGNLCDIQVDNYDPNTYWLTTEIRYPKIKKYKEWMILGIRVASTSSHEKANESYAMPFAIRPWDGPEIKSPADYGLISLAMDNDMGYAATGDVNAVGGGHVTLVPRPRNLGGQQTQQQAPTGPTLGDGFQPGLNRLTPEQAAELQKKLNGVSGGSDGSPVSTDEPITVTTAERDYNGSKIQVWEVKANVACTIEVCYGKGFKPAKPITLEKGKTWQFVKSDQFPDMNYKVAFTRDSDSINRTYNADGHRRPLQ